MCAEFMIRAKLKELARKLGAEIAAELSDVEISEHIHPYQKTVALSTRLGKLALELMQFSLLPSWSKESRVKFATHNARVETVDSKNTWKKPFLRHHCIVPMTDFIEPIYTGGFAGQMVRFTPEDDDLLYAAAIYDLWTNPDDKKSLASFAIVTSEPCAFVAETGHDRQPIFLKAEKTQEWLSMQQGNADDMRSFLLSAKDGRELKASKQRDMKQGWERRIKKG